MAERRLSVTVDFGAKSSGGFDEFAKPEYQWMQEDNALYHFS